MTTLLYIFVGLVAILIGLALLAFALLGSVPRFVGPPQGLPSAVATYWKGRLACLVGGPLLMVIGCMIISEPFVGVKSKNLQQSLDEAMTLADKGDLTGSMKALDRALQNADEPAVVYGLRGWILKQKDEIERAKGELAKAIEIDPEFSWPYAVQAIIAYQQGDHGSCREAADIAIKQADSMISEQQTSRRARFQVDGRSLAFYVRGMVNNDDGRYESAAADFKEYLKRSPKKDGRVNAQIGLSFACRHLKDYAAALRAAQDAISFDKKNAKAHRMLGLAWAAQGKQVQARKGLNQCVALSNDKAAAMNVIAYDLLFELGNGVCQAKLAIEFAEEAARATKRGKADYLDVLAACYAQDGRFQEAVRTEKEAIALDNKEAYRRRLAMYEKGKPCLEVR